MFTRTRSALLFTGLVLALTLVGLVLPAAAQTLPPWTGTYEATYNHFLGYQEKMTGSVQFEYEGYHAGTVGHHRWTMTSGTYNWEATGMMNECPVSGNLNGAFDTSVDVGIVNVYDDGTYFAELIFDSRRTNELVVWNCPVGGPLENPGQLSRVIHTVGDFFVKNQGTTLEEDIEGAPAHDDLHHFKWTLTSQAVPETELVFSADPALYADWLPTAGKNESESGSPITVTATLRNTDGSPLTRKAQAFFFELNGTSSEPGIALNYPKTNPLETPDLKFTGSDREILLTDPRGHGQFIIVKPEDENGTQTATVIVSPYDFGAFGSVTVEATLGGGDEPIKGRLESNAERDSLLLPRRVQGSLVADAWKQAREVLAFPDEDDSDALPVGDSHAGDGLTLYEEYRGFMIGGVHRRTNPKRKTILIRDNVGGAVKQGTQLYRSITGLEVYDRLLASEFNAADRIVNPNHKDGPHTVDQHGLWIRRGGAERGYAASDTDSPATPKHIRYIELPDWEPGEMEVRQGARVTRGNPLASLVAHELLHGSNVWHHGERDLEDVTWEVRHDVSGKAQYDAEQYPIIREGGFTVVQTRRETGERYTPVWISQLAGRPGVGVLIPTVTMEHGQHSGDEGCVMRYSSAWFFARQPADAARYEIPDGEVTGMSLCASHVGTGVNEAGRQPRYRHGDADQAAEGRARRGDCRHQLCINDRYH